VPGFLIDPILETTGATTIAAACSEAHRNLHKEMNMPKYIIKREIPSAGKLTIAELKVINS